MNPHRFRALDFYSIGANLTQAKLLESKKGRGRDSVREFVLVNSALRNDNLDNLYMLPRTANIARSLSRTSSGGAPCSCYAVPGSYDSRSIRDRAMKTFGLVLALILRPHSAAVVRRLPRPASRRSRNL